MHQYALVFYICLLSFLSGFCCAIVDSLPSLPYMLVWKVSQRVVQTTHLFDFLFPETNILSSLGFGLHFFLSMICLGFFVLLLSLPSIPYMLMFKVFKYVCDETLVNPTFVIVTVFQIIHQFDFCFSSNILLIPLYMYDHI